MLKKTTITVSLCFVLGGILMCGCSTRELGASVRPPQADILPSGGQLDEHPLQPAIARFRTAQSETQRFRPSGLTARDYLHVLDGQVQVFRRYQDQHGAIIDPVAGIEWQYSTPCYALSVALLAAAGYSREATLLDSGIRAMETSVNEMHEYRTAHNHGEFFIQPVMLALPLYEGLAPPEQTATWKRKLAEIDPYKLYPDNLQRKKACYNHNVVALAGEYLRVRDGLTDAAFLEKHLEHQRQYFNDLGMYRDNPGLPIVYDEFSRQFFSAILAAGYGGPHLEFYRERLWRGAWTSLFMQSPFGECPTGGRSAQHIWNEAQCAVTYEIYATQAARRAAAAADPERSRLLADAGAFKRAAHLSLAGVQRWLRPDGSGYIVKNRFPPEARHGFERYSAQSQYNLLACWLLAVAYLHADETIAERPCPADVGGFVAPIIDDFHKVFANAGGTYIEYETRGDLRYNPTGLIRVHLRGGNPQLGPSDGVVHKFDPNTKKDLGGERLGIGPAWQDSAGNWRRLADQQSAAPPKLEVLEESPTRVRFRLSHELDGGRLSEEILVQPDGVTVEDRLEGAGFETMRVYYPMLVFDGLEESKVDLQGDTVKLSLRGGTACFRLLSPQRVELKRTGTRLDSRNGQVEAVFADVPTKVARYRISVD